jgi:hypothetical protein
MPKFKIEYWDPKKEEYVEDVVEFEDTETVSADEWAEDAAYTAANKHWHQVTRLN